MERIPQTLFALGAPELAGRPVLADGPFPLTPALSPAERENPRPSLRPAEPLGLVEGLDAELPLPKGEGRGVGERGRPPARDVRRVQGRSARKVFEEFSPRCGERFPRTKDSRIEPLNRSSRRKEALTFFARNRVSLLTPAATRFLGEPRPPTKGRASGP